MTSLLAVLVLAQADGGIELPTVLYAEQSQLLVPDAGWVEAGPGCFLVEPRCISLGKNVAALQAENAVLRGQPHDFSFGDLWKSAWVGYALGVLSTFLAIGAGCWALTHSVICR